MPSARGSVQLVRRRRALGRCEEAQRRPLRPARSGVHAPGMQQAAAARRAPETHAVRLPETPGVLPPRVRLSRLVSIILFLSNDHLPKCILGSSTCIFFETMMSKNHSTHARAIRLTCSLLLRTFFTCLSNSTTSPSPSLSFFRRPSLPGAA